MLREVSAPRKAEISQHLGYYETMNCCSFSIVSITESKTQTRSAYRSLGAGESLGNVDLGDRKEQL
jgi:hypothetical protein